MFRNIRLFWFWKKNIKAVKFELAQKFNIRIDRASRLYTVVNIPEEIIGEAYSLKKSDIDRISETYLREFSQELSKLLDSRGLKELYNIYNIDKVDKYSYLMVFGFSLFKSNKYYNWLYFGVIPVISLIFLSLLIILL